MNNMASIEENDFQNNQKEEIKGMKNNKIEVVKEEVLNSSNKHNFDGKEYKDRDIMEDYYYRKKSNGISGFGLFFIVVFSFVVGGIVMIGLMKFTPLLKEVTGASNGTIVTQNKTQVYEKGSIAAAVEKIYDAVVVVRCYKSNQLGSTGTGFVYKTDGNYGYILTNAHVVADMEKVTVTFTDEEEAEVKVLGKDSYLDLAVLQVEKKYVSLIANIGSSENVSLGDTIFTVGSPMGYDYRGSVTSGVLSGKDRMVTVSVSNSSINDWVMRVLQIDASINPGNSGGPLLNVNGEVIGICSMKLVDDEIEGMGFAIPIEYAMNHVEQLEKGEAIQWPLLGITMANINDTTTLYRNNIRVSDDITEGVVVIEAVKDSAADKAGLKSGDVITKLNNNKVKDIAYLRYELYQHSAGDEVEITFIRDGKTQTTKVTLGKSS